MAYCPKCGVELSNKIDNCPLCQFPMPDLGQEEYNIQVFPKAQNIYKDRIETIKNQIFFTLIILLSFAIPILISIKNHYPSISVGINYAIISIVATILYVFFLFGYLKINLNILGICITAIIQNYMIDGVDGKITWFYDFAFFIIIMIMSISYIYLYLYKRSKHKNQFIYVPTYIFSAIGLTCIGIETVISYRRIGHINLSWSLIVFISSFAICILLLGLYHGLPQRLRNKIKRKFHV